MTTITMAAAFDEEVLNASKNSEIHSCDKYHE